MGLPTWEDNLQAYKISDVTAKADKFRNKKLLIVHGTAGNIYVLSRKITILVNGMSLININYRVIFLTFR